MKKYFKLILILLVVVLAIGILFIIKSNRNKETVSKIPVNNIQKNTNQIEEMSVNVASQTDPNIMTYTSYKLGIQFNYLKDGGIGLSSLVPLEEGDKISFLENNSINQSNYVRVFRENSGESVEKTLRRTLPEEFNNKNCVVKNINKGQYLIWDARVNLDDYDSDHWTSAEGLASVCNPIMSFPFITNLEFPLVILYINKESQTPSYWSNNTHTEQWWQTVHLIK